MKNIKEINKLSDVSEIKNKRAEAEKILKRELHKAAELREKINSYEAIKDVMKGIEGSNFQIREYNEKIKQYYIKIDTAYQNINYAKDVISELDYYINYLEGDEISA